MTTLSNAKWMLLCRTAQMLLQMALTLLAARLLGPSDYGLISYGASVTAFAVPLMQLGFSATLVREYVQRPGEEETVAGTALALNAAAAVVCLAGVTCFAFSAGSGRAALVCVLTGLSLLFQGTLLLECFFQAKLQTRRSSLALLGGTLTVSAFRLVLLLRGMGVCWFALSHSVEYAAAGWLLLRAWRRSGRRLRFSRHLAKELLRRSRHYILSGLMLTVLQNTDHIMLQLLSGSGENGFYTTAVTCACGLNFVYVAIADALRPAALENRRISRAAFEESITKMYSLLVWLSCIQCVGVTLLAKPMLLLLYGEEYLPAVPVLRTAVWLLPFSYMGTVRNIWILGEEKHDLVWRINLAGVITNVLLNALLIPYLGARGAALASVLTQAGANFLAGFFVKALRENQRLLLKGLAPRRAAECLRKEGSPW